MPTALPLVTRREIVREYRPDETVTVDSGIRALRSKKALSLGLSIPTRGPGGELGGRVHLYSALNRDAARAARRGDTKSAVRIGKAAARLETSPEAKHIAAALASSAAGRDGLTALSGAAGLARALSSPALTPYVVSLQRGIARARRDLNLTGGSTVLNGRIASLDSSVAVLELRGALPFSVPKTMLEAAQLRAVGAPVSAMWELLPGGRTLLTVEPAIDGPDVNDLGEPLVDLYGTPWGQVLTAEDADMLNVTGAPTVTIPEGIPEVA
ncbi:MAG: hypothetical protein ACHQE6_06965 [Solirubrobacterales bacterium]